MTAIFNDRPLTFLVSLFFCVHPINGLLVNYLTTNGFSVMILAMNLAIIWHLKSNQTHLFVYRALSLISFIAALLCHETAGVLPFYLAVAIWVKEKTSVRKIIFEVLPYLLVLTLYFILRSQMTNIKSGLLENIPYFALSWPSYIASCGNLLLFYVNNLIFLENIVLIRATPIVTNNLLLVNLGFAAMTISLFYLTVFRWKNDIRSLIWLWFFFGILPVALACFSRPNLGLIIEPHWLFYPSIAFFVFLSYVIVTLARRLKWTAIMLTATIVTVYILNSWDYNKLWSNEKQYCRYMLALSPKMDLPNFWLADAYWRQGNLPEAKEYFYKSLRGKVNNHRLRRWLPISSKA